MIKKVDLHVHSKYSEHPSEWFLQRLGAFESYTEPEYIYKRAKEKGMDFVTITDHNKIDGALILKELYPNDTFVSMEATTYFPEDKCKIHILFYDINQKQYQEINKLRENIYELREYIKKEDIAYSVAHATYSVNNRLELHHLEKLILLFDIFEGINGGRDKKNNETWINVLKNLNPNIINKLYEKHKIEPMSNDPWIKGFTGGSDDHSGLFIAKAYTIANGENINEFINNLKNKHSLYDGLSNDYQALTFAIFKIIYDYSKTKKLGSNKSIIDKLIELVFEEKSLSWLSEYKLKTLSKDNEKGLLKSFIELADTLKKKNDISIDKKINIIYDKTSNFCDEFFSILIKSVTDIFVEGNFFYSIQNISSSLPGIFIAIPFLSILRHMNKNRELLNLLEKNFSLKKEKREKNILWFSDTINDLNGVSVTIQKIREVASKKQKGIKIVGGVITDENIENFINLPIIHKFSLPYYEKIEIMIPSFLKSLEIIYNENPDEIIISTPGTIGLVGLISAKLLNIKSIGIYHTDFSSQIECIKGDESLTSIVDNYINWFYQLCDEIRVPSYSYINILEQKGFSKEKMKIFRRGIDTDIFYPKEGSRGWLRKKFNLENDSKCLIYAGRISKDKNLDIIVEAFNKLDYKKEKLYLLIVGDGPYKKELEEKINNNNIIFTGRVNHSDLVNYYSGADLFLFPSTTDTFGMAVLEAQACGLPAMITDYGGPKEIVQNNTTGFIISSLDPNIWKEKIEEFINNLNNNSDYIYLIKKNSKELVKKDMAWEKIVDEFIYEKEELVGS